MTCRSLPQMSYSLQQRQALQTAAENHLPLVLTMVRRFPGHEYEPEELYQQGCIGLMKALARYDPSRGTSFSTYAAAMILGEMRMLSRLTAPLHIPRTDRELHARIRRLTDELTRQLHREPTVQELASVMRMDAADLILLMEEVTVTSTDAMTSRDTPLHEFLPDTDDWLTRLELQDILSHLPEQDRDLLRLRWSEGLSQTETGKQLGLTQLQVSRREAVLRRTLQKQWLEA